MEQLLSAATISNYLFVADQRDPFAQAVAQALKTSPELHSRTDVFLADLSPQQRRISLETLANSILKIPSETNRLAVIAVGSDDVDRFVLQGLRHFLSTQEQETTHHLVSGRVYASASRAAQNSMATVRPLGPSLLDRVGYAAASAYRMYGRYAGWHPLLPLRPLQVVPNPEDVQTVVRATLQYPTVVDRSFGVYRTSEQAPWDVFTESLSVAPKTWGQLVDEWLGRYSLQWRTSGSETIQTVASLSIEFQKDTLQINTVGKHGWKVLLQRVLESMPKVKAIAKELDVLPDASSFAISAPLSSKAVAIGLNAGWSRAVNVFVDGMTSPTARQNPDLAELDLQVQTHTLKAIQSAVPLGYRSAVRQPSGAFRAFRGGTPLSGR